MFTLDYSFQRGRKQICLIWRQNASIGMRKYNSAGGGELKNLTGIEQTLLKTQSKALKSIHWLQQTPMRRDGPLSWVMRHGGGLHSLAGFHYKGEPNFVGILLMTKKTKNIILQLLCFHYITWYLNKKHAAPSTSNVTAFPVMCRCWLHDLRDMNKAFPLHFWKKCQIRYAEKAANPSTNIFLNVCLISWSKKKLPNLNLTKTPSLIRLPT